MSIPRSFNLNRLSVYAAVVETGSIRRASTRLSMSASAVSDHLQRLEADLGVNLLNRTTRQLSVTRAGHSFYQSVCDVLERAGSAIAATSEQTDAIRGVLRIAAPSYLATQFLVPMLVRLGKQYPDLQFELISDERRDDPIGEGIDVAIQVGTLPDSTYRAIKIAEFERWLVASPDFAMTLPARLGITELKTLPFVGYSGHARPLSVALNSTSGEIRHVDFEQGLLVDSTTSCRAAVLAGGGIALLTAWMVEEHIASGHLVRVLPDWSSVAIDIHAVMPPSKYRGKTTRIFLDALKSQTSEWTARVQALAIRRGWQAGVRGLK